MTLGLTNTKAPRVPWPDRGAPQPEVYHMATQSKLDGYLDDAALALLEVGEEHQAIARELAHVQRRLAAAHAKARQANAACRQARAARMVRRVAQREAVAA